MPTYTITGVADAVRDWNSQLGGAMKGYRIDLKGADGSEEPLVEWSRKAASPAPTVGMSVDGDVEQGQYGKKFKKAQGSFNGGGGSKDFKADPVKQAAIAMEHSQKAAIDILTLAVVHADYRLPEKVSEIAEQVRLVAKSLYAQIHEVSEAAK